MLVAALRGLALGIAWGVAARIWMRLISTEPEFSWEGTVMILAIAGVAGLGLGLIHGAKAQGRTAWWMLAIVIVLPLFAGQGLPFLPALLLGGLALGHRAVGWRVVGVCGLAGSVALLAWLSGLDAGGLDAGTGLPLVTGYGGFMLLSTGIAAGGSVLYRPASSNRVPFERAGRQGRQVRAGWRSAAHAESRPSPDHG